MHPAPIGVADRTGKKYYWRTVPGQHCLLAEEDIGARTEAPLRKYIGALMSPAPVVLVLVLYARHSLQSSELGPPNPLTRRWVCPPPFGSRGDTLAGEGGGWGPNTRGQTLWYSRYHVTSFTSPIGGPNISMRLAYFHPDRLLTGLYKQETEIPWSKDDSNINKQTDIDCHGPEPSLNSSQPPVPPPFFITHYL